MAAESDTATAIAADKQPLSSTALARWTPSLPTALVGMLNPFNTLDDSASKAATADAGNASKKTSFFSSILPSNATAASTPAAPSPTPTDDESIMFAEPDSRSNSEGGSREGSIDEKLKKSSRPKTRYSICHPPPASAARQRMHRRPRSLLQLHRLSPHARPQPAYEVIPSANFSVKLTKSIGKVFRAKHGLCPNDLVVLKAEKYSAEERSEEQDARDMIALICKGRKEDGLAPGKAKIYFAEGREWEAYSTANGGYEFFCTDEHGLGVTVRWVLKKSKDGCKSDKRKFNFSTISPTSRKHPVIAMLSRTSLDVCDRYRIPDASAATPLSTPKRSSTVLSDTMQDEAAGEDFYETDDRLREIIAITSIWVAFKEGWSPNFRYEDKEKDSAGLQRSPSLASASSPSKAATFGPVSSPPASPTQLEGVKKTGRTRADSASTVLVHRAASNRTKNNQASWRAHILTSQEETQEQASSIDIPRSQSESDVANTDSRELPTRPITPPTSQPETAESEVNGLPVATATTTAKRSSRHGSIFKSKRESSATSETKSSASEYSKKPAKPAKKKSGWRRLFCGGRDV